MLRAVESLLERRTTVYAACVASFVLGLFFIFVWTPLPWGWKGIDDYGRIETEILEPMEQAYELVRELGTGISHHWGAFG